MKPRWLSLSEGEQNLFRAAVAFLTTRLEERNTVEWALRLNQRHRAERTAILAAVSRRGDLQLKEPWHSAWRLIEESWENPIDESDNLSEEYIIGDRIKGGDRSGSLISSIVSAVRPVVRVDAFSESGPISRENRTETKICARPYDL